MPSLSGAMNAALSGLKTYQKGLNVEANNVSNAFTEGYTRKTLPQTTCVLAGQGRGVLAGVPLRHVHQTFLSRIRRDLSELDKNVVQHTFLSRTQDLLGQPGQNNSLGLALTNLEKSFQGIITQPSEVSKKLVFIEAAQNVAQQLNIISNGVQKIRQDIDAEIAQDVLQVNEALQAVYHLNGRIAKGLAIGAPVGDLQDQRDKNLETIAQKIAITVLEDKGGRVSIETTGGRPLLEPEVFQLQYTSTSYMTPQSVYLHADNGGPGTISPLMLNGYDMTRDLTGGSLKGLIELRDSFLPNVQQQMDMLATQLKAQLNAISNQGSAFPPPTSLTGSLYFNATTDVMGPLSGLLRVASINQNTGAVVSTATLDLSSIQGGSPSVAQFLTAFNTTYNAQGIQAALSNGTNGYLIISTNQPQSGVALGSVDLQPPPMGNATQGFSAVIGLNDLFLSAGDAQNRGVANSLSVNPTWLRQPGLLSQGLLSTAQNLPVGSVGLTIGDTRNVQALVQKLQDKTLTFPAIGSMTAMTGTLSQYTQTIISQQATLTGTRSKFVEEQEKTLEQLRVQEKNLHGVDLDGSMFKIMEYQSAYNANFQVMNIANQMLEKLELLFR